MRPVLTQTPAGRTLVLLLLVASTVGWRRGQYFSGSLDPVVLGKGLLSLLALAMAFGAASAANAGRRRLGTGSVWLLAVVLASSVFGALTYGTLVASALVAFRVAVLALTVFFLLRTTTVLEFFSALAWSSGAVGLVAAVTGWRTASSGRLEGGLPPLTPNELALLASLVVLYIAWRIVLGRPHLLGVGCAALALGIIWLTGSRTALLMLIAALAVMALHVRRARVGLVLGALVVAGAGSVAILTTGALGSFLERDGTGTSTLDSRFIAWNAAGSWASSTWQLVFGGGLSVKIIQVHGQWWNTQPLDSSWISLLVQAGFVGLLVAAVWALWALRGALHAPHAARTLFLPALVYLIGRGFLESGLFDATPAFLAFMAISLLSEGPSRGRLRDELRPAPGEPALRSRRVAGETIAGDNLETVPS